MAGVNFAFSEEVAHYHTPLDSLHHLDPGSLQHQGDNALAMTRTLAGTGPGAAPGRQQHRSRFAAWLGAPMAGSMDALVSPGRFAPVAELRRSSNLVR